MTNVKILPADKPIAAFSKTQKEITRLSTEYENVIFDVKEKEGLELAKKARQEIRAFRFEIEAKRKELKAPVLEYSRRIDEEAKAITSRILEIEEPIDEQIKAEEKRLLKIKEEEEKAEVMRMQKINEAVLDFRSLIMKATSATSSVEAIELLAKVEGYDVDEQVFFERCGEIGTLKASSIISIREHVAKLEKSEIEREQAKQEMARLEKLRVELEEKQKAIDLSNAEAEKKKEKEPAPATGSLPESVAAPDLENYEAIYTPSVDGNKLIENGDGTVTIPKELYLSLESDSLKLKRLMDAGVEEWDGYFFALDEQ